MPEERLCEQAFFVRSAQQLAHRDNLLGYGYIGRRSTINPFAPFSFPNRVFPLGDDRENGKIVLQGLPH